MTCPTCGHNDDKLVLLLERLRFVSREILLVLDAMLLLCSLFWRKNIKSGVVRDSADDLLDLRSVLMEIGDELDAR